MFGHGNQSAFLSLFHHLGIAKIRSGSFFWRSRAASLSRWRIGNIHMVAIKQGYPVRIQSITYEQGQSPTKHICSPVDELMGALLRTRTYNNGQN